MLVEKGWDPAMGARPLRRAIQRHIEDPLADFVLRAEVPAGSTVVVDQDAEAATEDADEGGVTLSVVEPEQAKTPVGVGADSGEQTEGRDEPTPPADSDGDEK